MGFTARGGPRVPAIQVRENTWIPSDLHEGSRPRLLGVWALCTSGESGRPIHRIGIRSCLERQRLRLHTSIVRHAVAIVLSLMAAGLGDQARAEVIDLPVQPQSDPDRGNFWRDMLWPHKDEVDLILQKVRQALGQADMG